VAGGIAGIFGKSMKFAIVTEAPSEAEAYMYRDMLESSGIKAVVTLPSSQQVLKANAGGASMPFNTWEIRVPENMVEQARDILPEQVKVSRGYGKPSPGARSFALFWLTSILLGLALALRQMFEYFF
jgi:hypothetical protein